mmetsp:Transcript_15776/g.49644  ORF Transcript_15776/g.49644 Transcript_15776/m.49644 type:complete len:241 (-) Transcript_15776:195-917(-)
MPAVAKRPAGKRPKKVRAADSLKVKKPRQSGYHLSVEEKKARDAAIAAGKEPPPRRRRVPPQGGSRPSGYHLSIAEKAARDKAIKNGRAPPPRRKSRSEAATVTGSGSAKEEKDNEKDGTQASRGMKARGRRSGRSGVRKVKRPAGQEDLPKAKQNVRLRIKTKSKEKPLAKAKAKSQAAGSSAVPQAVADLSKLQPGRAVPFVDAQGKELPLLLLALPGAQGMDLRQARPLSLETVRKQ